MLEISFSDSFKRSFKKRIKGNETLARKFRSKLAIFRQNPFDQRLKTHKLSGKLKDLWSFSLEYDQRIWSLMSFFATTAKISLKS